MGIISALHVLVTSVLIVGSVAITVPTPPLNATTTRITLCPDDNFLEPPPANRTLIEQMDIQISDDGILPECYKQCMKSEDKKADIDISKLTVQDWCYDSVDFVNAQTWLNNYVFPCVKYECADNMGGKARRARAWMRDTCEPRVRKSTHKNDGGCDKVEEEQEKGAEKGQKKAEDKDADTRESDYGI
ncbi:hypothetical protein PpBr36_03296 [Pyricularia pennisetigena]|uniref:hypothetical protein n=1 Tax=Pyricularia pennisetigena TaxID=1578925 RepID=UPI00115090AC|nr:hypothetical protein PpBr36_03296 [Pyricularia pennisetigena]TLS30064.1 hypothetical protein PpBr36_03296 [Pyricularia pennisetigena]